MPSGQPRWLSPAVPHRRQIVRKVQGCCAWHRGSAGLWRWIRHRDGGVGAGHTTEASSLPTACACALRPGRLVEASLRPDPFQGALSWRRLFGPVSPALVGWTSVRETPTLRGGDLVVVGGLGLLNALGLGCLPCHVVLCMLYQHVFHVCVAILDMCPCITFPIVAK